MNATPAPDSLAPHVATVSQALTRCPGMTVREIRQATNLGEDVVRVVLDRLASQNAVHCTKRESKKRGSPPREYRPGPCPILTEPTVH